MQSMDYHFIIPAYLFNLVFSAKENLTYQEFKNMYIPYLSLLKIKLIKECNELEYNGDGKLSEFVENKYTKLKVLYPTLDDSKLIRMIISCIRDDKLVEEFAMSIPKSYELFKKEVLIYDKEKFPFLCADRNAAPSFDIKSYLKYIDGNENSDSEPPRKSYKSLSSSLTERLSSSARNLFN